MLRGAHYAFQPKVNSRLLPPSANALLDIQDWFASLGHVKDCSRRLMLSQQISLFSHGVQPILEHYRLKPSERGFRHLTPGNLNSLAGWPKAYQASTAPEHFEKAPNHQFQSQDMRRHGSCQSCVTLRERSSGPAPD